MSEHEHQWGSAVQRDLFPIARELRREIPAALQAFSDLHAATMGDGAIDAKTKELIALAIAVTQKCDGCIAAHAKGAVRKGATRAEVAEVLGVTIMMNGGPGTVYAPRALDAYDDFAAAPPTA